MSIGHRTITRRRAFGLVGALALLTAAACASEPKPPPNPTTPPGPTDPDGATMQTAANDPAASAYQAGATGFALSMLSAAIGSGSENAVISPLSISQCISLVGQGANGATLTQIAETFGCADADELRSGANAEITAIAALTDAKFDMANTTCTDESFEVKANFAKAATDWFGVAPHTTDFADPDKATSTINAWVSERTNDKIPKLLAPGQVTTDTRTVLVNALYLKALWASQFNPDKSSDRPFTLSDGSTVQAKFMQDHRDVRVTQQDGATLIELPYEDDDLTALFYLPTGGTSLADAAAALAPSSLEELVAKLDETDAKIYIPTFEVRQRLEVKDALKELGILDAFDPDKADFSALAYEPTYVAFVQHEAWLKVGEKGTEGAAATAAGIEASAAPGDEPLELLLDRPFLFAVRVRSTGSVAFVAAVQDPSQK